VSQPPKETPETAFK